MEKKSKLVHKIPTIYGEQMLRKNIYLPVTMIAWLEEQAEKKNISFSQVIRDIIQEKMNRQK